MSDTVNASYRLHTFFRLGSVQPPQPGKWSEYARDQFREVAAIVSDTAEYATAYESWKAGLHALRGRTRAAEFRVEGRMVVGIGQASVLENSITLHRLWGTPYIPGSALKGLARHYARWVSNEQPGLLSPDQVDDLFGTTDNGGLVTFHDAWYVPGSASEGRPLVRDVVTGHHGDWYQQKAHPVLGAPHLTPPWDFADPNPVSLLSARGHYLVVVQADPGLTPASEPDAWTTAALDILTAALDAWGAGAKTNAGYGRLVFERDIDLRPRAIIEAEQSRQVAIEAAAALRRERAGLEADLRNDTLQIDRGVVRHWSGVWERLDDPDDRTRLGIAIVQRLQQRKPSVYFEVSGRLYGTYTSKKRGELKTYFKPLLDWLDEHAPEVSQP